MISEDGLKLIQKWEGCRLEPYQDIAGVWTIGYGHTGELVVNGRHYHSVKRAVEVLSPIGAAADVVPFSITLDYANALLRDHLNKLAHRLKGALQGVALSQRMADAIYSLAYNIGAAAFLKSTALKRLKATDYKGAAEAMTWWNKARNPATGKLEVSNGLSRRRAEEAALFLQGVDDLLSETEGCVEEPGDCASCG